MDVRKLKRVIRDFGMANFYKDAIQVILFENKEGVDLVFDIAEFTVGNWGPRVIAGAADWAAQRLAKSKAASRIELNAFNNRRDEEERVRLCLDLEGTVLNQ